MREYLDKAIKADKYAQYVDDIGIATNTPAELKNNLREVFQCIRAAGLRLTMAKCQFGAKEVEFLGRTISPSSVAPQSHKIQKYLQTLKVPRTKKGLQSYIGFVNYYRNYIPPLSEKIAPFHELIKCDKPAKIDQELISNFEAIKRSLDNACGLWFKQPLPTRQYVLMTDANFKNAGYALMTEEDPEQKITSTKKTYAPVAFGSKTFSPSQLKMSIYAKEFLAFILPSWSIAISYGVHQTDHCPNRQQVSHEVFSNQNDPTLSVERLRFCTPISLHNRPCTRTDEHGGRLPLPIGHQPQRKSPSPNQRRHPNNTLPGEHSILRHS